MEGANEGRKDIRKERKRKGTHILPPIQAVSEAPPLAAVAQGGGPSRQQTAHEWFRRGQSPNHPQRRSWRDGREGGMRNEGVVRNWKVTE